VLVMTEEGRTEAAPAADLGDVNSISTSHKLNGCAALVLAATAFSLSVEEEEEEVAEEEEEEEEEAEEAAIGKGETLDALKSSEGIELIELLRRIDFVRVGEDCTPNTKQ